MTSSPVNITIAEIRICKGRKRHVIILAFKSTNVILHFFLAIRLFKSSGVISRRACTTLYVLEVLLLHVVVLRQHRAALPEIGEAIQRIDGLSRRHGWGNKVSDIMRRSGNRERKEVKLARKDMGTWCFVETYSPVNRESELLDISIIRIY